MTDTCVKYIYSNLQQVLHIQVLGNFLGSISPLTSLRFLSSTVTVCVFVCLLPNRIVIQRLTYITSIKFLKVLNKGISLECRQADRCICILLSYTLAPGVSHHTTNCATCSKCNILHRPDEAILFVMVKPYLQSKIILLFRAFKKFALLHMDINRMKNLHLQKLICC